MMKGRAAGHRDLHENKERYDQFIDCFLLIILPNNYCTHYWTPYLFPVHGYSTLNSNNTFFFTNFTQTATKLRLQVSLTSELLRSWKWLGLKSQGCGGRTWANCTFGGKNACFMSSYQMPEIHQYYRFINLIELQME